MLKRTMLALTALASLAIASALITTPALACETRACMNPDSRWTGTHYETQRPTVYAKGYPKRTYAARPKIGPSSVSSTPAASVQPSGLSPAVTRTAPATDNTAQRIYTFYRERGYSHYAVVGKMGNLKAESNFSTRIVGDGGLARGLAQWHPDRWRGLVRHAKMTGRDPHDLDVQLEWVEIELKQIEVIAERELHRADCVESGTKAFIHFERPLGYQVHAPQRAHGYWTRLHYAKQFDRQFEHLKNYQFGSI